MIVSKFLNRNVMAEKEMKAMIVPTRPKSTIFWKLAKNFFLCMLKPAAKTMGGNTK